MSDVHTAWWDTEKHKVPFSHSTMKHESPWHFQKHRHMNFFELVCVHDGHFRQEINGVMTEQPPRTLIMIRDADVHQLWGDKFTMTNVMISTHWVRQFEDIWGMPAIQNHLFFPARSPMASLSESEWQSFCNSLNSTNLPGSKAARTARFSQFFLNLLMSHFLKDYGFGDINPVMPGWLAELVDWIARHREHPIRVEDVVEQANRCPEHVSRSFRKYLGATPSQYLNRQRVEKATELLRTTDLPILEVCYGIGFDNPSYFHRVFRKTTGLTPGAYRSKHSLFRNRGLSAADKS